MGPVSLRRNDRIAVVTIDNPPVNALSVAVRAGLAAALSEADSDSSIDAIVIAAAGRAFIAGAEIREFGLPPRDPSLPDVIAAMDRVSKPLVAAITGVALGGGLEVALGCHARVATPGAKLGLPEVKLGILPGAGGTQRLPRLVGAAAALQIMTDGEPITATRAEAIGLVDLVTEDALAAAQVFAGKLASDGAALRRSRDVPEKLTQPDARGAFEAAAEAAARKAHGAPAQLACIQAVRAAFELPFDEALQLERALFQELVQSDRSKALRYVFFAERESARVPGIDANTPKRPVERVAVIGAGTMGGGIAMCFANAGIPVTLIETSNEALEQGTARIASTYEASVKRGSLTLEDAGRRRGFITGAVGLEAVADCDLVVEAVFEELALKREIFHTVGHLAKPGAILATNTSYLDVNSIAAASGRAQDVLGMHFFSPANVMRLLEIVRADATAPDVLATAAALGRRIGKVPVVVGVCHGFVGNRMLGPRSVQAERLLLEGALPHEVDAALTAFGFRMGPFAMADLAGLDIGWRIRRSMAGKSPAGRGSEGRAPVADALCEAGRLGQKTGRGFYLYTDGSRTPIPDPEVEHLVAGIASEHGITRRRIESDEITERLIFPMINEGARILEEGIAARGGDIDTIWIAGYNWPAWRGGPMHYADHVGLEHIARRLDEFAAMTGDESLRPAELLMRLVAEKRGFASVEASR